MTLLRGGSDAVIWGEDFADDGWQEIAGLHTWAAVHPDEFIRLFPRLARSGGPCPEPLLRHLTEAIGVRLSLLRKAGRPVPATAGLRCQDIAAIDAACLRAWFPSASGWRALGQRLRRRTGPDAGRTDGMDTAVLLLDPLLGALKAGRHPPYAESLGLGLAFHAGIHPAYLWDEAFPSHECGMAVGWLGIVARGRSAMLPLDIAGLLAEAIDLRDDRTSRPRDPRLAFCPLSAAQWASLGLAARRRLAGRCEPVRLTHSTRIPHVAPLQVDGRAMAAGAAPR